MISAIDVCLSDSQSCGILLVLKGWSVQQKDIGEMRYSMNEQGYGPCLLLVFSILAQKRVAS